MNKQKNVFISHHGKDDKYVQQLKARLKAKGYHLKNSSVDSTKPNRLVSERAIRRLLRMRIHWAGTFICLVGEKTHTRAWVDWEIKKAHEKGKPIVGIFKHGCAKDTPLPSNLEKYHSGLVGWNMDKIIDTVENGHNEPENPDGTPRNASFKKSRVSNC